MKKPVSILIFWILNSFLLYLATLAFPESFELGTYRMSAFWSAIVAGLCWTLLVWLEKQLIKKFGLKLSKKPERILFYIVANFVTLWVVARLAPYTGFGVVSFVWVFGLAVTGACVQFGVWRLIKRT